MPYDVKRNGNSAGSDGTSGSRAGTARLKPDGLDVPSAKYKDVEMPSAVIMQRASSPPKPTLPRRSAPKSWRATTRERYPLTASLTGAGRAGKFGELLASSGGKYEGEILAGRPHGHGRYMAQTRPGEWETQYEGDWIQGRREGRGSRYYNSGETYTGDFVANLRHGNGRYEYSSGDTYAGQWCDDKRHGAGTIYFASGDIFIGNFYSDRREGMGTLFMMARQKKYVAEYAADSPRCGTVLELEDTDLAPVRGHLAQLALAHKLDKAAAGEHVPRLPELQLQQPNKVLASQVVAVRRARADGSKALREVQATSGTLTEREIEMLRHSYTLMAVGDTPTIGLLPHQLRELCVMAGLDPAASSTRSLVEELVRRKDPSTGRINFDNFMKVAAHFQDEHIATHAAAAVEAIAQATLGGIVPNAADLLSEGGSYAPDAAAGTTGLDSGAGYSGASGADAAAPIEWRGTEMVYAEGTNGYNHASDAAGEEWDEADGQYEAAYGDEAAVGA